MCVHPCTCEAQKHIIHIPFLKAEFGYHGDPSSIASMKCAAEDGTSIWLEYDRGEEQMPWLKGCQSQIHKSSWGHGCISDDTTDSEQARQKDICFYTVGRYKNTHTHSHGHLWGEGALQISICSSIHSYSLTTNLPVWLNCESFLHFQRLFIPFERNSSEVEACKCNSQFLGGHNCH